MIHVFYIMCVCVQSVGMCLIDVIYIYIFYIYIIYIYLYSMNVCVSLLSPCPMVHACDG
jgi:hypothetical protein